MCCVQTSWNITSWLQTLALITRFKRRRDRSAGQSKMQPSTSIHSVYRVAYSSWRVFTVPCRLHVLMSCSWRTYRKFSKHTSKIRTITFLMLGSHFWTEGSSLQLQTVNRFTSTRQKCDLAVRTVGPKYHRDFILAFKVIVTKLMFASFLAWENHKLDN